MTRPGQQRPLLGYFVAGYPAAWIDKQLRETLPDQIASLRRQGITNPADALEFTMNGITEAAQAYHQRMAETGQASQRQSAPAAVQRTTKEAALQLGVTDRQVRNLVDDGALSGSKQTGRWLIEQVSIDDYVIRRAAA